MKCHHRISVRTPIRFRRWSRKAYGVLMTLHREVTLGRVCRSIADAALLKSGSRSCCFREAFLVLHGRHSRTDETADDTPPDRLLSAVLTAVLSGGRTAAVQAARVSAASFPLRTAAAQAVAPYLSPFTETDASRPSPKARAYFFCDIPSCYET